MVQNEFQAIVFAAGTGSRMSDITSNVPKCLLPIGGKPMIWYSIQMLEHTGFQDVIVITLDSEKTEIQSTLDNYDIGINVDYFPIPSNEDLGTADSLRLLNDKIKNDVICISCDLITDIDLCEALNIFRKHNASIVSIFFKSRPIDLEVPGPKMKHKPERDLIGVDSKTNRLVFLASASDFEENLTIQKQLLKKHTDITIYSTLTDAHLYIMKNWICNYLQHEKTFSTIKGELIPHIVRKQMSRNSLPKEEKTSIINTKLDKDIFAFAKEDNLAIDIRNASNYNDHFGDNKDCYHGDLIRCFAYIADEHYVGLRLNTIPTYWTTNSKILDIWNRITFGKDLLLKDPKADVQSTQLDNCIIWNSAKLSEKTSFKNSNIGVNSIVHSKTRVINSILMNNVVIEERCVIENCIVCFGAIVKSGCQLKNCIVGSQHIVVEDSIHCKEVLTDTDKLMEF